MSLSTQTEAWITGTVLGLFRARGRVPGTNLTVHEDSDVLGNWSNRLLVKDPDGLVVAHITVTDVTED